MARLVLGSISAALVLDGDRVFVELSEDSEIVEGLPIAGPALREVLPARQRIELSSAAAIGLLATMSGQVKSVVASVFAPHALPPSGKT